MAKRNLLKLPDDLEGNLRALLHTPPPPHDIPGSRKAAPKPKPTPKAKRRKHTMEMSRRHAERRALAAGEKAKKRKAAKKR